MLDYFLGATDVKIAESLMKEINEEENKYIICDLLIKLKKKVSIEEDEFNTAFTQVQDYFKENQTETKDDISNLALLDSTTNRSYGNAFFPIKRQRIIENDSKGIFVPIATKNLFLKYYSRQLADVMYWNSGDAKDYLEAIKTVLKDFLK